MNVNPDKVSKELAAIRWRKLGDKYIVTNDSGRFLILSESDFEKMLSGQLAAGDALRTELEEKLFYKTENFESESISVFKERNNFLNYGPNLHIIITTLRCNLTCVYCHASRAPMEKTEFDMSEETARKVVDRIFESTSSSINIEFQGGEPLANWEVVKFVIDYARKKNESIHKELAFSLVTNLTLMDEEKMNFLVDHDVWICTSLDGPKELQEKNRIFTGGASYDSVVKWIGRFRDEYLKRGFNTDVFHVDALMTTTRDSLSQWKEIVDEYVRLGIKSIHIRPLNPFGFVEKSWSKIGYSMDEFLEFYRKALDYIIRLNLEGVEIIERQAALYLTKILSDRDPNFLDLRSPCGAGIGQVAYNYDGLVYTCDEARMMARMGDDIFEIGHLDNVSYNDMIDSDAVKTLIFASTLENVPRCANCVYKPYCGVCPIYNYKMQGDIFGDMYTSPRCRMTMDNMDAIFEYLAGGDERVTRVFERWITLKMRQIDAPDPYC